MGWYVLGVGRFVCFGFCGCFILGFGWCSRMGVSCYYEVVLVGLI